MDTENDCVYVQYGKNRYYFEFPPESIAQGKVTVSEVKDKTALAISTSPDKVNLLANGQVLKNDSAPLSSYRVKSGVKLLCMASKNVVDGTMNWIKNKFSREETSANTRQAAAAQAPQPPRKLTPLEQIEKNVKETDDMLSGSIIKLESGDFDDAQQKSREHDRLAEVLLQRLLKLDGIDVSSDGPDRTRRKEAVKWTQDLLTRVDDAMKSK